MGEDESTFIKLPAETEVLRHGRPVGDNVLELRGKDEAICGPLLRRYMKNNGVR